MSSPIVSSLAPLHTSTLSAAILTVAAAPLKFHHSHTLTHTRSHFEIPRYTFVVPLCADFSSSWMDVLPLSLSFRLTSWPSRLLCAKLCLNFNFIDIIQFAQIPLVLIADHILGYLCYFLLICLPIPALVALF